MLLILAIPAIGLLFAIPRRSIHPLVRWLVGSTLAITIVIFTSPGTGANHLLDITALAILILSLGSQQFPQSRRWVAATVGILGISIIATWSPGIPSIPKFFQQHGRPAIVAPAEFFQLAGASAHPVLSENPLIPILVDERPFVADAFNLDLLSRSNEGFRESFESLLEAGYFGTVVLTDSPGVFVRDVTDPTDSLLRQRSRELQAHGHLMARFSAQIWSQYRVVFVRRPYIYLLRNDLPFPAPNHAQP